MAIVMSLREAGFDIGPLIAGAGIAGVAIGFGAQALVRDVISGGFMLLEDQVRVGDVVVIDGTGDSSNRSISARRCCGASTGPFTSSPTATSKASPT